MRQEESMLPDFLICGAPKAGTTSLYSYLRQHPTVFMPRDKELNYFTRNYAHGLPWYRRQFEGAAREQAIGEASPSYLWHPRAAERIAALLPDARLLFVLRNPVERAYSHYWFYVSRGMQDAREPFTHAIRTRRGRRCYVEPGAYMPLIARYLERFDARRLHVMLADDLRSDPRAVVRGCYAFLGVSTAFVPAVDRRHNTTLIARHRALHPVGRALRRTLKRVERFIPASVRTSSRPLRTRLHRLFYANEPAPPMPAADRAYLRELYEPHNAALADFLGRDAPLCWA